MLHLSAVCTLLGPDGHSCFIQTYWFSLWVQSHSFILFSLMQDPVQQRWRAGQGDREGTPGGSLRDMRQRFRWADCPALCWTYHCHPDIPEHHGAHHQLPQQDQTGRKARLLYQSVFRLFFSYGVTDFSAVTLHCLIRHKTFYIPHRLYMNFVSPLSVGEGEPPVM